MNCPHCGFDNPSGLKFCGNCGTAFGQACPACGFENPPQFKFCGQCGAAIAAEPQAPEHTEPRPRSHTAEPAREELVAQATTAEAERRHLTVLFCDLVDSTKLAAQLGPEDWREVVRAYQTACTAVVTGYDGYVAQYLGDGVLTYFGYPRAHEDDTQRAVRAGRDIVNAVPRLNAALESERGVQVAVRIGIHTGLVVVGGLGEGTGQQQLAVGEAVNIAARLQEIAEPNSVVISEASLRLVQGLFIVESLGVHSLDGVSDPTTVYCVTQAAGVRSRTEAAAASALTPLVGREQEAGLLLDRWEQVTDGVGQVVLLCGEAGIGKTRLVQTFRERLAERPHVWFECRSSSFHQNSALYPITAFLQEGLLFDADDTPDEKLDKLEWAIGRAGFKPDDTVPFLAPLLSLPLPDQYPASQLNPELARQRIQQILLHWLIELARRQPLVLLVEDLHWADPSTLEFLGLLVDACPTTRSLFLFTYRPDFSPPWPQRSHLTPIVLNRLTRRQSTAMIEGLAEGRQVPQHVVAQITTRADGMPLFIEELTKTVLQADLSEMPRDDFTIPATLQDSLMARLDQLEGAKEHAQLAATIGREFSYGLLKAVWHRSEAELQEGLARLVEAELIYQRGLPPSAAYVFKHALIQETAYQSLLKTRRREFHLKIARTLEERFPEQVESEPEQVARHYEEAGVPERAIAYCQLAGERSNERWAHAEAIGHLTRGIELLQALPEGSERKQREALLQFAIGAPLMASKGNAHPDVERTYGRARELCQEIGEMPGLSKALFGLATFYLARGQMRATYELGEQLLRHSEREPDLLLWARLAMGVPLYFLGSPRRALDYLQEATEAYEPAKRQSLAVDYAQDPRIFCQSYASLSLWHLGHPDRALRNSQEIIEVADRIGRPLDRACTLGLAAGLHHMRREPDRARERSEAAIAVSAEHGLPQWLGVGTVFHGWALVEGDDAERGIEELRRGLAQLAATATRAGAQQILGLTAESYRSVGLEDEAFGCLELALGLARENENTYWDSELHRLKGDLLLRRGAAAEEVEREFQLALGVAAEQQARSLELRAATSLARLWQQQGRKEEAREVLAPVYDWFTEGFDTRSREARALLDGL